MTRQAKARLEVRQAALPDVDGIVDLVRRSYDDLPSYSPSEIRAQLHNYAQGCFVAVLDDRIVGYCASFRIRGAVAFEPHSWREITGAGTGARHDAKGECLYGYEMCVDPKARGARIGRRLYEERRNLAEQLELNGIVFAGRIPNYSKNRRKTDGPDDYLDQVQAGKIHDPVIRFQLANGFEPIRVLGDYLPSDAKSLGNAVLMVWRNPYVEQDQPKQFRLPRGVESVRVATCQLHARAVSGFDDFIKNIEYFVDVAAGYRSDFIVFPELFTLQLLSCESNKLSPLEAIEKLSTYTPQIRSALAAMAMRFNINIIGGSHPTTTASGEIRNVAFVCLRNGAVAQAHEGDVADVAGRSAGRVGAADDVDVEAHRHVDQRGADAVGVGRKLLYRFHRG